jgi:flagellar hook assembly protein FlgD
MKLQTKIAGFTLLLINLIYFNLASAQGIYNQQVITPGTLTFTVKTITNNSTYSPKNVIAIWIKDALGNFVVSRKVMAVKRIQHLVKWNASSLGNVVSATTGATLTMHQAHTITWDGKNAAGTDMPDGIYQIWVEYVSTNAASNGNQGPSISVEFTKGLAVQHITPANATYFQNIIADWVPLSAGLNNLSKTGASLRIFPNPFSSETTVLLNCDRPSQAYICVYDASGKKVSELLNDSFSSGARKYTWDGKSDNGQNLMNGMYFVQIQINGYSETQKVILNR